MGPGQSPLDKVLYSGGTGWTVVGVIGDVLAQDPGFNGGNGKHSSVFFPLHPRVELSDYILRSAPKDRDRIVREAVRLLGDLEPGAVVDGQTYAAMREAYFADNRSMVWMLLLVCAVMLAVTAFGIVGLTSFLGCAAPTADRYSPCRRRHSRSYRALLPDRKFSA